MRSQLKNPICSRSRAIAFLVLSVCSLQATSDDRPIRFYFTGTVTSVTDTQGNLPPGAVSVGQRVSGYVEIDLFPHYSIVGPDPDSSSADTYWWVRIDDRDAPSGPFTSPSNPPDNYDPNRPTPRGLFVDFGGAATYQQQPYYSLLTVGDYLCADRPSVCGPGAIYRQEVRLMQTSEEGNSSWVPIFGWVPERGSWGVFEADNRVLDDKSIPETLDLADWTTFATWFISSRDRDSGTSTVVFGIIDSISASPTPVEVPAHGGLTLLGLFSVLTVLGVCLPPNKSVNRTFYSGPTCGGFAIFTFGRATVKRRLPKR